MTELPLMRVCPLYMHPIGVDDTGNYTEDLVLMLSTTLTNENEVKNAH